jgi:type II secretory pathway component PulK
MAVNDLSVVRAADVLRSRPRGGWESVDAFLRHPGLNAVELNEAGRAQFSLQTRYYILSTRVERLDAAERSVALLEQGSAGRAAVVRRIFGAGAGENPL